MQKPCMESKSCCKPSADAESQELADSRLILVPDQTPLARLVWATEMIGQTSQKPA